MKQAFFIFSVVCGATAGFLIWNKQGRAPAEAVEELAHRLEGAWADHHTVV